MQATQQFVGERIILGLVLILANLRASMFIFLFPDTSVFWGPAWMGIALWVILAAGQMTLAKKKFYGQTAPILARQLSAEFVRFPGHHLSYFDMPQKWAAALKP